MKTQADDLAYGYERERVNQPRIEKWLGFKLRKLDKYHTMDWVEEEMNENPWWIEQKARKVSYEFVRSNYRYNGKPTALIGKNKIDYMKKIENGIVLFDFTDKLMYWRYDEDEYKTFDVEERFLRGGRSDVVDTPHAVVHIPLERLEEVPVA